MRGPRLDSILGQSLLHVGCFHRMMWPVAAPEIIFGGIKEEKCDSEGAKIQKFAENGWFWPFFSSDGGKWGAEPSDWGANAPMPPSGFFPGGTGGSPPSGENFANPPPIRTCPRFWTKACPPPAEVRPRKFEKIKYVFVSNLTTFKLKSTLKSCISCLK